MHLVFVGFLLRAPPTAACLAIRRLPAEMPSIPATAGVGLKCAEAPKPCEEYQFSRRPSKLEHVRETLNIVSSSQESVLLGNSEARLCSASKSCC